MISFWPWKKEYDATNLSDFLDFAAAFADKWATLAGRHNKAHGDRGFAGGRTVSHWGANVLEGRWRNIRKVWVKTASHFSAWFLRVASKSYLLQFLNDHGEGFKNGGGGSREGYDPLRTVALWDVDASATLHRQGDKQEIPN